MQSANRVVSFDAVQRSSARDWGSPKLFVPGRPDEGPCPSRPVPSRPDRRVRFERGHGRARADRP
jgi:hypothetical protein